MSLSTPVFLSYNDSPSANLDFLKSLTSIELRLYAQGYIQCSSHVQEAIVDAKNGFLNAILADPKKEELLNYVTLLDSLESTLQKKVVVLKEFWPDESDPL